MYFVVKPSGNLDSKTTCEKNHDYFKILELNTGTKLESIEHFN